MFESVGAARQYVERARALGLPHRDDARLSELQGMPSRKQGSELTGLSGIALQVARLGGV